MHQLEESSTSVAVIIAVAWYSILSSTLLLANKIVMAYIYTPAAIGFAQVCFATLAVCAIKGSGMNDIDWFEWVKVKPYIAYVLIWLAAIYANMQALASSNVETVIVFRACTPIAVCVIDSLIMGRELPSGRSALSLGFVVIGAAVYCLSDSEFQLRGFAAYYWVSFDFVLIVIEKTYGKILTSEVKMRSVWGPVLYCNAFSIVPLYLIALSSGELEGIGEKVAELPSPAVLVLLFTFIVGTLIGYSGWLCRSMISATTFTLIGVCNKFITVLLNVLLWDKHSTPLGLFAVCICLLAGTCYQQAPKTTTTTSSSSSSSSLLTTTTSTETGAKTAIAISTTATVSGKNETNPLIPEGNDAHLGFYHCSEAEEPAEQEHASRQGEAENV